mgnify:CR=1 FL=1
MKKSLLPEWEELIEINELFSYIIRIGFTAKFLETKNPLRTKKFPCKSSYSQNAILLFEVQECLETGLKTAAWAFLKLRQDCSYVDRRIRLQLYNSSPKGQSCFSQILSGQLTKMTSSLHVTVSKLPPLTERDVGPTATNRSMRPDQVEIGKADLSMTQNFHDMISRYVSVLKSCF